MVPLLTAALLILSGPALGGAGLLSGLGASQTAARESLLMAPIISATHVTQHAPAAASALVAPEDAPAVAGRQEGAAPDTLGAEVRGPVPVPEPGEKALSYYRSGMRLWGLRILWGIGFPALVLFTGFSARIRDGARRVGKTWALTAAVFALLYFSLDYLADLPLDFYSGFVRQHAYDLSNQSFGAWMGDSLKGLGLTLLFVGLVVPGVYLFLRKAPKRWWLYTGIAAIVTMAFIQFISPVVIAPLFDDFGPMQDQALEADILALADRAGIEDSRVFEVNKSEDTNAVNAYVTGYFGTKRIVLWDTIIEKLNRDQLLFVMGHEMGHYVLGHAWRGLLFTGAVLLLALYVAHRTVGAVIDRFRDRFGFERVQDVASLPLLLLLVGLFSLAVSPLTLAANRYHEREADRFGLEITRDNYAAGTSWLVLQRSNLANPSPGPVYRIWRATHPILADRIEFSNTYRPWETGGALKYERYFSP